MPVPRVSVRNSVRKPISPRPRTRNSIRTQPVPWLVICSMRPLRTAISWVIVPRYSSGASMVRRSTGSCPLPVADGELEALAAHLLDEDRQRQLATALDLPGVGTLGVEDLQRDVAHQLLVETVLDQPGRDLGVLGGTAACQRRGVDADRHGDRGLVDLDQRQCDRVLR